MNTACKIMVLVGPWITGCLAAPAQEEHQEPPFEMQVLLKKHHRKIGEGTITVSKMTIAQLERVKADYLRADRVDDALAVAEAIKSLQNDIARIQERLQHASMIDRAPRKTNNLRAQVSSGKWIRTGKRPGIGRSIYTLKPDGTAEGFILTTDGRPGGKTAWIAWELRGKTLKLGTETFEHDDQSGEFVGTLSNLKKQEEEAANE